MTIDDIMSEWDKDKKIDSTTLDTESLRVPELHHKYHKMLNEENRVHRRMIARIDELRVIRWQYFTGKLDQDTLVKNGWEPFDLKIVKQDVQRFMDGDTVLNRYSVELGDQKAKIDLIKSIMTMVSNRSFQINNAIKWQQFLSGQ